MTVIRLTTEEMADVNDTAGVTEGHDSFASMVVYQLFGTWQGTVTFENTLNNTDWDSIRAENLSTGTLATTTTANGTFRIDASGLFKTRARFSTDTSGTVKVQTIWVIG